MNLCLYFGVSVTYVLNFLEWANVPPSELESFAKDLYYFFKITKSSRIVQTVFKRTFLTHIKDKKNIPYKMDFYAKIH